MTTPRELAEFLNEQLNVSAFLDDPSNNGLQFDAGNPVRTIVFGVDANLPLFQTAADIKADMIVVHHGISWGGSLKRINSVESRRLMILSQANCSLYAAHLPMDAHPVLGHNAELARMLDLQNRIPFGYYHGYGIGFAGALPCPMTAGEIASLFDRELDNSHTSRVLFDPDRTIRRAGIVSGGGAWSEIFLEMKEKKLDCLITGEFTHESMSYAQETGAECIMLGHYRSECPGLHTIMTLIRKKFPVIDCRFVSLPTGF